MRVSSVDVCANPDVIATNEEYAWISAFHFWTTNNVTEVVVPEQGEGDFGSSLNIINGALECPGEKPQTVEPQLKQDIEGEAIVEARWVRRIESSL